MDRVSERQSCDIFIGTSRGTPTNKSIPPRVALPLYIQRSDVSESFFCFSDATPRVRTASHLPRKLHAVVHDARPRPTSCHCPSPDGKERGRRCVVSCSHKTKASQQKHHNKPHLQSASLLHHGLPSSNVSRYLCAKQTK